MEPTIDVLLRSFFLSSWFRLLDPLWLKGLIYVYLHLHNDFGKMKPHCVEGPTRVYFLIHRARPDRAMTWELVETFNVGPEPHNWHQLSGTSRGEQLWITILSIEGGNRFHLFWNQLYFLLNKILFHLQLINANMTHP